MSIENTVIGSWCENTVPKLARFNQIFIKRNGKGFAHTLVLKSKNEKDIQYCFEKEKAFFKQNGWICVLTDDPMKIPTKNILIIRTATKENEIYNEFCVEGVGFLDSNLKELVDLVGFEDLTLEYLKTLDQKYIDHLSECLKVGVEKFVNDLLMNHYNHTDVDTMTKEDKRVLFGTSDLNPKEKEGNKNTSFKPEDRKQTTESKDPLSNQSNQKESKTGEEKSSTGSKESGYEEVIKAHSISSKGFLKKSSGFKQNTLHTPFGEPKREEAKAATEGTESAMGVAGAVPEQAGSDVTETEVRNPEEGSAEYNEKVPESSVSDQTDPGQAEAKESETEAEENPEGPPAPVKVKKITFKSKETLTEEDKKSNAELLHNIRSQYEETLRFIKNTHSPQYTLFVNLITEALESNKYTKQWCPMYLEISDDLTTEVYARLYELDHITADFNKKLIHQVMHIGCPFCANEWDEDVTFIGFGVHYTRCPKCANERPFEKTE